LNNKDPSMTIPLTGRVALVTGAPRGIGAAIARALAEAGADVAINYRNRATEAESVAAQITAIGRRSTTVSQSAAVATVVRTIENELGSIDILINNAGIALIRGIDDLTEADFNATISVNLKSVFLCTQAVLPHMRTHGWGRIMNISSGAARGAAELQRLKGRHRGHDAWLRRKAGETRNNRERGCTLVDRDRHGEIWPCRFGRPDTVGSLRNVGGGGPGRHNADRK
jgi:NAD(P)-dependent dehydrogenase (short-subunit alcohol dehydrogenase family)